MGITEEVSIEDRIAKAQKLAKEIFNGEYDSMAKTELFLRVLISKHYNIPIFSDYFTNLTLDQLIFEVEMVKEMSSTPEERMKEKAEANKEELDNLFADWDAEDIPQPDISSQNISNNPKDWEDVTDKPLGRSLDEEIKRFMDSGKFKNE